MAMVAIVLWVNAVDSHVRLVIKAPEGHSTFFQVGVCSPDFRSVVARACELIFASERGGGACELKISKFGCL